MLPKNNKNSDSAVLGLDLKRRYIRAFPLHCRLKLILHAACVVRQKLVCATPCKIEFVLDAKTAFVGPAFKDCQFNDGAH